MQRAHREFLAGAGLAGDEHGQVGARDELDLAPQLHHRRALAEQAPTAAVEHVAHELARDLAFLARVAFERDDQVVRAQRGGAERGELLEETRIDVIEGTFFERIGRQHADELAFDPQRTTQARMHVEVRRVGDEPVVGIGQARVGREERRRGGAAQDVEARMFAAAKAPAEDVAREAVRRDRDELVAVEAQQHRRIARQRAHHGRDEAPRAVLARQRRRHVERDREQRVGGARGGSRCGAGRGLLAGLGHAGPFRAGARCRRRNKCSALHNVLALLFRQRSAVSR
jgi:hypothetical protein